MIFVIENVHHDFVVHEKLCTNLFESIQDILPSAYKGLFLVHLKTLRLFYIRFLFNYYGEQSFHSSYVSSNPMDIAKDIMAQVEVCLAIGTSYHHSILPPSGRTSSSEYHDASIHNYFIHCSTSQLPFLLLDCFLVSSNQVGSRVIFGIITNCFGFSFFLGIFMFFLMSLFSSWVHGSSIDFMP